MLSLGSSILDFNSVVCSHHIYKDVWTPFTGEELTVQQDSDNEHDGWSPKRQCCCRTRAQRGERVA